MDKRARTKKRKNSRTHLRAQTTLPTKSKVRAKSIQITNKKRRQPSNPPKKIKSKNSIKSSNKSVKSKKKKKSTSNELRKLKRINDKNRNAITKTIKKYQSHTNVLPNDYIQPKRPASPLPRPKYGKVNSKRKERKIKKKSKDKIKRKKVMKPINTKNIKRTRNNPLNLELPSPKLKPRGKSAHLYAQKTRKSKKKKKNKKVTTKKKNKKYHSDDGGDADKKSENEIQRLLDLYDKNRNLLNFRQKLLVAEYYESKLNGLNDSIFRDNAKYDPKSGKNGIRLVYHTRSQYQFSNPKFIKKAKLLKRDKDLMNGNRLHKYKTKEYLKPPTKSKTKKKKKKKKKRNNNEMTSKSAKKSKKSKKKKSKLKIDFSEDSSDGIGLSPQYNNTPSLFVLQQVKTDQQGSDNDNSWEWNINNKKFNKKNKNKSKGSTFTSNELDGYHDIIPKIYTPGAGATVNDSSCDSEDVMLEERFGKSGEKKKLTPSVKNKLQELGIPVISPILTQSRSVTDYECKTPIALVNKLSDIDSSDNFCDIDDDIQETTCNDDTSDDDNNNDNNKKSLNDYSRNVVTNNIKNDVKKINNNSNNRNNNINIQINIHNNRYQSSDDTDYNSDKNSNKITIKNGNSKTNIWTKSNTKSTSTKKVVPDTPTVTSIDGTPTTDKIGKLELKPKTKRKYMKKRRNNKKRFKLSFKKNKKSNTNMDSDYDSDSYLSTSNSSSMDVVNTSIFFDNSTNKFASNDNSFNNNNNNSNENTRSRQSISTRYDASMSHTMHSDDGFRMYDNIYLGSDYDQRVRKFNLRTTSDTIKRRRASFGNIKKRDKRITNQSKKTQKNFNKLASVYDSCIQYITKKGRKI